MDLGLIFGIVLVLLILTFGTLTIIFSLKSWHWLHITAFVLVLLTLPPAMYHVAAYARTAREWGVQFQNFTKKLSTEKANNLKLNVGDPPMSAKPTEPGRIQAVAALDRLVAKRGRVWRNCVATQFAQAANNVYVSKVTTLPQGTQPPDVAKNKNGIAPQTEVFIFRQILDAANNVTGLGYLGRFGVLASTENDIDVTPHEALTPQQATAFAPGVFLTVYETLPADDNSIFDDVAADARNAEIDRAFAAFADNGPLAAGMTPEAFKALVDSYKRHGGEKLETDRPEEVWTRVKFLKDFERDVDAASVAGVDTQLFDTQGRAIRGTLQRGEAVKFKKGEEILLDGAAAEELIRNGDAEKVADIYQRVERDFDTGFRILGKQAIDIAAEMQKIQRNIAAMTETNKKLESEIAYRTKEKEMLTSDLTHFENDAKVMKEVGAELNAAYQKLVDKLSEVYRKNQDMLAKISEVDAKITEQVDQRSQTASGR